MEQKTMKIIKKKTRTTVKHYTVIDMERNFQGLTATHIEVKQEAVISILNQETHNGTFTEIQERYQNNVKRGN